MSGTLKPCYHKASPVGGRGTTVFADIEYLEADPPDAIEIDGITYVRETEPQETEPDDKQKD